MEEDEEDNEKEDITDKLETNIVEEKIKKRRGITFIIFLIAKNLIKNISVQNSEKKGNEVKVFHQKWEKEEKEAVLSFFKLEIKKSIVPGQEKCLECIRQYPVLDGRHWKKVKYFVKNQIQKNNKLKNKIH